jgi:hypothetical protein
MYNGSQSQLACEFGKWLRCIKRMSTMPYQLRQNQTKRRMRNSRWQRCASWEHTVPNDGHGVTRTKPRFQIQRLAADELCGKRAPEEIVTGNTPDIQVDSQYVFSWICFGLLILQSFRTTNGKTAVVSVLTINYTSSVAYYILYGEWLCHRT